MATKGPEPRHIRVPTTTHGLRGKEKRHSESCTDRCVGELLRGRRSSDQYAVSIQPIGSAYGQYHEQAVAADDSGRSDARS